LKIRDPVLLLNLANGEIIVSNIINGVGGQGVCIMVYRLEKLVSSGIQWDNGR